MKNFADASPISTPENHDNSAYLLLINTPENYDANGTFELYSKEHKAKHYLKQHMEKAMENTDVGPLTLVQAMNIGLRFARNENEEHYRIPSAKKHDYTGTILKLTYIDPPAIGYPEPVNLVKDLTELSLHHDKMKEALNKILTANNEKNNKSQEQSMEEYKEMLKQAESLRIKLKDNMDRLNDYKWLLITQTEYDDPFRLYLSHTHDSAKEKAKAILIELFRKNGVNMAEFKNTKTWKDFENNNRETFSFNSPNAENIARIIKIKMQ